jgi:cell division protein FtsL
MPDVTYKRVIVLALAVFVSAMLVVELRQTDRIAFSELQVLVAERDRLEVERGQYLLEQAAFSENRRVDDVARSRLDLAMPAPDQVVLLRGDGLSRPPMRDSMTMHASRGAR